MSPLARVRRALVHRALRLLLSLHALALALARLIGGRPRPAPGDGGLDILLTGTFHSENWIAAHLRPLAASSRCASVRVVSASPIPAIEKVTAIHPPRWLARAIGAVPARLLVFAWTAVRTRPHVVGGFHLLVNGLLAAVVARLVGARSLYFCVGGAMEVLDGGIHAENRLFALLETADPLVEERLIRSVAAFDIVVTMGGRAAEFFQSRGVEASFHVLPGGIDAARFAPALEGRRVGPGRTTDVILVGRLAPIKRVDIFLRALAQVRGVTAAIVGDGALRASLERLARRLRVDDRVTFAGERSDVQDWLRRASALVLTSDSEGLPLSVLEAMACGLPVVVSAVGELPDVVEDGVNGYLVRSRDPAAFAGRIRDVLDPERRPAFSRAARRAAERHDIAAAAARWECVLEERPDAPLARA